MTPWWAKIGGQENPRPQAPAHAARRSVYEDREPVAFPGGEPEAGWRRIGEIDPATGAWRDGPRWLEQRRLVEPL